MGVFQFSQKYGVNYLETFALVSRHDTIRAILALAAQMKWKLYQMDVKSAFLNGELKEEIYVVQPPGFIVEGEEGKFLRLQKALYGLKQAPRAWYGRIDAYFLQRGFQRSMEIIQDDQGVFLSQEKYSCKMIEKFGMKGSKRVSTPLTPHGKDVEDDEEYTNEILKYHQWIIISMCIKTGLDVCKFISLTVHVKAAEKALPRGQESFTLYGYSDSDWGGSNEDKKSTYGYVFTLGSGVFCWQSSKQQTVAQSKAEYIVVCAATNQAIWLQRLMEDIGFDSQEGVPIYCDNKSAMATGKNLVQHRRTKHIEIKYHFVREAEHKGLIKLKYCEGEVQLADLFTKALSNKSFEELRSKLGVRPKLN
uniref:Putative pol polyprotein n=1 Tax=Boechera divaricarpa TaxID=115915 RepID=B6REM5_9BRAS|nr:putative pol polyprotein [Boechera divaricarpa]